MRLKPRGLTCIELVELVTEYLEGTLSWRDRRRFEAHISGCPHCTAYLAQMRAVIESVGELREEAIEPQAKRELLEAFSDWRA